MPHVLLGTTFFVGLSLNDSLRNRAKLHRVILNGWGDMAI